MTAISAASPARGPPAPKLHICQGRYAENFIHPPGRQMRPFFMPAPCGHISSKHKEVKMLTHKAMPEREDVLADINALFEKSDMPGQVLWHPTIRGSDVAPEAVAFIEETMRAAIIVVSGLCSVDGSNWRIHDTSGGVSISNPLERAWRAAEAVRNRLRETLGKGGYTIPVVMFPHMTEDADIVAACRRRKVRLMWGLNDDFVDTLAALPEPDERQTTLTAQFIAEEIAILQEDNPPAGGRGEPQPESPSAPDAMDLTGRGVLMQHVDQVVINIILPGDASTP